MYDIKGVRVFAGKSIVLRFGALPDFKRRARFLISNRVRFYPGSAAVHRQQFGPHISGSVVGRVQFFCQSLHDCRGKIRVIAQRRGYLAERVEGGGGGIDQPGNGGGGVLVGGLQGGGVAGRYFLMEGLKIVVVSLGDGGGGIAMCGLVIGSGII